MAPSNTPWCVWRPQTNWFWYLKREKMQNPADWKIRFLSIWWLILIAILGVEYRILAKTNWFPQNNWQFLPDFGCWCLKFVGFIIFWYAHLLISYISSLLLGRWSPVIFSFWGVGLFLREYLQENHGKPWKTLHCKDWMEVLVSFLLNRLGLSQLSKTPNEKEPERKPLYFNHQNMLSGSDFPSKAKWTPENNS